MKNNSSFLKVLAIIPSLMFGIGIGFLFLVLLIRLFNI